MTVPATEARRAFGRLSVVRRLGTSGAVMAAVAALGAGALPVPNPLFGMRVLGLPGRVGTLSLALAYAGAGLVLLAWVGVARLVLRPDGVAVTRAQLVRVGLSWALPLAVAPPFSRATSTATSRRE